MGVQLKRDPESAEWVNFKQLFKMANVEEKSLSREKLIEAAKQKSKPIISSAYYPSPSSRQYSVAYKRQAGFFAAFSGKTDLSPMYPYL